jgi:hypothetical protein
MTAATPWAAISWWNESTLRLGRSYAQAGTHALGDACEEKVPIADAARAATQEVPFSTGSSRRLIGEGEAAGAAWGGRTVGRL